MPDSEPLPAAPATPPPRSCNRCRPLLVMGLCLLALVAVMQGVICYVRYQSPAPAGRTAADTAVQPLPKAGRPSPGLTSPAQPGRALNGASREVPTDLMAEMHRGAATLYPKDRAKQEEDVQERIALYHRSLGDSQAATAPVVSEDGVPPNVLAGIKRAAHEKWPDNPKMQGFDVQGQITLWRQTQTSGAPLPTSPAPVDNVQLFAKPGQAPQRGVVNSAPPAATPAAPR